MDAYVVVVEEALQSNQGKVLTPPRFIVVEPKEPDCLFQSAKKGDICLSERNLRKAQDQAEVVASLQCHAIGSTLTGSELGNRLKFLPYSGLVTAVLKVGVSATMRDDREWGCRQNDISPNASATSVLAGHKVLRWAVGGMNDDIALYGK
ncbi:uncharacterized protein FOBCDRAFT_208890 [Fusarium oxysporum Fo47]|uniref:uncharacterized protein n=1 Tax=Fusarium oxysporum Fo47 TaxID=660027 RepID=UPI002869AD64|nr:uncharacterized protein FOBCDRAFT_208890 [Fusarium oxysporum Fo47]QJS76677.2 hypothetical protein FOBCDRAFT_208890 [Fusarium oxysporum Fo47]